VRADVEVGEDRGAPTRRRHGAAAQTGSSWEYRPAGYCC
jgi:hypothetical protein